MIIDVAASEVQRGDWLADGRRVEAVRVAGGMARLAVRKPSWRCRKLVALAEDAPVRVLRVTARVSGD